MKSFSDLWQYLAEFLLEWEIFRIKVGKDIKTRFILCKPFFENRAVYEVMLKNVVEPQRLHTIWCMFVAYWIDKTTSAQAILIAFPW